MSRLFFDTSVLTAAFWGNHPRHQECLQSLSNATRATSACGSHTLAELYSTLTALPIRPSISPEQSCLLISEVVARLTIVPLSVDDYVAAIEQAATSKFISGRIYDVLLLQCARSWKADILYTLNL